MTHRNIDSKGREWITRKLTNGESLQCTCINGKWYRQSSWGYGNENSARKYNPEPENIIEQYHENLYMVLIPINSFNDILSRA